MRFRACSCCLWKNGVPLSPFWETLQRRMSIPVCLLPPFFLVAPLLVKKPSCDTAYFRFCLVTSLKIANPKNPMLFYQGPEQVAASSFTAPFPTIVEVDKGRHKPSLNPPLTHPTMNHPKPINPTPIPALNPPPTHPTPTPPFSVPWPLRVYVAAKNPKKQISQMKEVATQDPLQRPTAQPPNPPPGFWFSEPRGPRGPAPGGAQAAAAAPLGGAAGHGVPGALGWTARGGRASRGVESGVGWSGTLALGGLSFAFLGCPADFWGFFVFWVFFFSI